MIRKPRSYNIFTTQEQFRTEVTHVLKSNRVITNTIETREPITPQTIQITIKRENINYSLKFLRDETLIHLLDKNRLKMGD